MKNEFSYEFVRKVMDEIDGPNMDEAGKTFAEMMMMYNCAIREVRTKIEVLNDEFQVTSKRNPIDSIKSRVKKPISIYEKAKRKGYPMTFEGIMEHMDDIAGIRVICPFIEDIYAVAEMITNQDDLRILSINDYIQNPKPNGYRSLHVIVEVPIFLSNRKVPMKVEIQIRTIAMDFWASLEHQIHYKKSADVSVEEQKIVDELKACADTIFATDERMENIRIRLEKLSQTEGTIL
jgi:putative GTP pyrophosphokinase